MLLYNRRLRMTKFLISNLKRNYQLNVLTGSKKNIEESSTDDVTVFREGGAKVFVITVRMF